MLGFGSHRNRTQACCRTISAIAFAVMLFGPLAAGAQGEHVAPGESASSEAAPAPNDLYATWRQMAGQAADRIERSLERLVSEPPAGVVGDEAFLDAHISALEASEDLLNADASAEGAKLESHQKSVLAFLDRATQINTKIIELADAAEDDGKATQLRMEIEKLAETRFFGDLDLDVPAKLIATIEGDGRDKIYWPQTIAKLLVRVSNAGDLVARKVTATLTPKASKITSMSMTKGKCSASGNGWMCTLDELKPADDWPIRISFQHSEPDSIKSGPPQEVQLSVSLAAADTTTPAVDTSATFRVADCAANYHRSLEQIFEDQGAQLLTALNNAKSGNRKLPGRWVIAPRSTGTSTDTDEVALASKVVKSRGIDPWLTKQANGRQVARVAYGLRTYLRQSYMPALCTGMRTLTDTYREFLAKFDKHRLATEEAAVTSLTVAQTAVASLATHQGATENKGPAGGIDDLIAVMEAIMGQDSLAGTASDEGEQSLNRFEKISRMAAALSLIDTEEARLAAKSAVSRLEIAYYLDRSNEEYGKLLRAFDNTIDAIHDRHKAECVCETGDYSILPKDAAVSIPGEDVPLSGVSRTGQNKQKRATSRTKRPPVVQRRRALRRVAPRRAAQPRVFRRGTIRPGQRTVLRRYIRRWDRRTGRYVLIPVHLGAAQKIF